MERRTLGTSGFEVPVVGMGTSRTFDVRGRAARRPAAGSSRRPSTTGPTCSTPRPCTARPSGSSGSPWTGAGQEAIVATKVWTPDDGQAERQIETSLRHAHGRIELYQIHNLVAWPARLERLERLRDDGLVDVVGPPTTTRRLRRADDGDAQRPHRLRAGPLQPLERDVERAVLPLAEGRGSASC